MTLLIALLLCSPAAASIITTASSTVIGPPGFTCAESMTGTVGAWTTCSIGGIGSQALAKAGFLFASASTMAAGGYQGEAWTGNARASAYSTDMVVPIGGTGSGVMTVTYHTASGNGCFNLQPNRQMFMPFTYGTPFGMSARADAFSSAGRNDAEGGFTDCYAMEIRQGDAVDQLGNVVTLVAAPVPDTENPEPGTWALVLVGLGALTLCRLRRRFDFNLHIDWHRGMGGIHNLDRHRRRDR